jgi:hypothetical protein
LEIRRARRSLSSARTSFRFSTNIMPRFDQAEIVRSSTHAAYLLQAALKYAFAPAP